MSENLYDWEPGEIEAAWRAYDAAPDTVTKDELREIMNAARKKYRDTILEALKREYGY